MYTITNTSDQPVTFNLPPADFIVNWVASATSGPAQIWESDPGAASQPTTSETLQPGQSLTETASWDGMANEGPMANTDVFADNSYSWFAVSVLGAPPIADFGFTSAAPLQYVIGVSGGTTGPNGLQTFGPGQLLTLTATETNIDDLPVTILNAGGVFELSGGPDDEIIIPAADIAPVGQIVTLQPGQSQTFTATWDPASDPTLPSSGSLEYGATFEDNSEPGGWPYIGIEFDGENPPGGNPSAPPSSPATGSPAPLPSPTSSVPSPCSVDGDPRRRAPEDDPAGRPGSRKDRLEEPGDDPAGRPGPHHLDPPEHPRATRCGSLRSRAAPRSPSSEDRR